MRDRNEVLFYRLLAEHLGRDAADVYTPDGWEAIERYTMNTPPAWRVPVGKSS